MIIKIEGTMAKKSFEEKVFEMRRFQKAYFKSRCPMTLASAKRAEAEVDDALCALFPSQIKPEPEEKLPSLFD